ncbi:MAG: oxidoreductase, partial [Coleofasciculaceae cyanobacterium]
MTASSQTTTGKMKDASTSLLSLTVAPAQVLRGEQALELSGNALARFGSRPLVVGGKMALPTKVQIVLEQ